MQNDGSWDTGEADLLERAPFLAELGRRLEELRRAGRMVLIGGEAGAGKTVLLRRFCFLQAQARALWGSCDPLFTPQPFGPLPDIGERAGGALAEALDRGANPDFRFDNAPGTLGVRRMSLLMRVCA